MNLEFNPQALCLRPNQLLKVHGGIGHAVVCHSGSLWVTQHRDGRDIVLRAGESFALDRKGLVLVQALEQSALSIAPPAARIRAPAASALPRRTPAPAYAPAGGACC
jgi:hypothetical protein